MYGEVIRETPTGFVPYHQWPEYQLQADVPTFLAPRAVGKKPVGMYRRFWPIVIEEYMSDEEPVLADSDPKNISLNRTIIWQRLFRTDMPEGWKVFSQKPPQLEGFALLDTSEYWEKWSESARRYRRKWHDKYIGKEYLIEAISAGEFNMAYIKSDIKKNIRTVYTDMVKRKITAGAHIEFLAARHIASGEIAAAMAMINSPTHKGSHYLCGFIGKEYGHAPAMIGVMDAWHARSFADGTRFLHFGRFWQQGDPDEWKGFSLFKSKFGLSYISYPPALWRFQKGRLF